MKTATAMVVFLLAGSAIAAPKTETEVGTWADRHGVRITLSIVQDEFGKRGEMFIRDQHGVDNVLAWASASELRDLRRLLDKQIAFLETGPAPGK